MSIASDLIPMGDRDRYQNLYRLEDVHSKNKTPVLGNVIPALGVKLQRGSTCFGYFSR